MARALPFMEIGTEEPSSMKLAISLILCLGLSSLGCGDLERVSSPEDVFQMTFPGKDRLSIWHLEATAWQSRDDTSALLKFEVTQEDLNTLFDSGFKPTTSDKFSSSVGESNPILPWWTPMTGPPDLFMESSSFHGVGSGSHCYYSYHIKSKTCYVWWREVT
jgi:hypothetical protein